MKPSLVIMAAGLGTRYGGFKQLDSIGPKGEIIMDYSIFDALEAGFGKIILIVQEQMIEVLNQRYNVNQHLGVEFVVQYQELIIANITYTNPKPWGTAHALWCAKSKVNEPFLLINADDFYGKSSFKLAFNHLSKTKIACAVVYPIRNTLTANGTVNRAEVKIKNGYMVETIEREKIQINSNLICYPDAHGTNKMLENATYVSMNMWGFSPQIFDFIDADLPNFILKWKQNNAIEYQLPNVVAKMIKHKILAVKVIHTNEEWIGITYKEDKQLASEKLKKMHDSNIYKSLI